MENNVWRSVLPVFLWIGAMTAVLGVAFLARNFTQLNGTFALEREIGAWLTANSSNDDIIMSTVVLKDRPHVPVPTPSEDGLQAPTLLDTISAEMPTFVVTSRTLDWQYVTGTPWFKERYRVVAQFGQGESDNTAVPYTVWQYAPTLAPSARQSLRVNVDNRFNLVGAEFAPESINPGDAVRVTLYYEAQQPLERAFKTIAQVLSPQDGRPYASVDVETPHSTPLGWWETGQIISESFVMTTTADMPVGAYKVNVAMRGEESLERWPMYEGQDANALDQVTVGYVAVPSREPLPITTRPVSATLGHKITLHSYDLQGETRPGNVLDVVLHWEGAYPEENYQVFVHLLDEAGTLASSHDGPPVAGRYPSRGWRPGDIVPDPHPLTLDSTLPPGTYRLKAGLYHPQTLERLPVTLADGSQPEDAAVVLGTVTIE